MRTDTVSQDASQSLTVQVGQINDLILEIEKRLQCADMTEDESKQPQYNSPEDRLSHCIQRLATHHKRLREILGKVEALKELVG